MARAENARAVASMVKVKARAAAEAVMADGGGEGGEDGGGVGRGKGGRERGGGGSGHGCMGVTAVLLPLQRDAPSALVIIPVGWPSTLAADRSGFGTSGLARSGVLAQNCVGAGERGGGASADD